MLNGKFGLVRMVKPLFVGVGVISLGLTLYSLAPAQSDTRGSGTRGGGSAQSDRRERPALKRTFEQKFWNYLQAVKYENWAPLPGTPAGFYPGEGPHGAFLKLYANRTAAGAADQLPYGSILIKKNYGPDRKTLMAVTVMYRVKDYNPGNRDWYWMKFEPNGQVSEMAGMPLAGQVQMCADCHSGAAGDDLVFAND